MDAMVMSVVAIGAAGGGNHVCRPLVCPSLFVWRIKSLVNPRRNVKACSELWVMSTHFHCAKKSNQSPQPPWNNLKFTSMDWVVLRGQL